MNKKFSVLVIGVIAALVVSYIFPLAKTAGNHAKAEQSGYTDFSTSKPKKKSQKNKGNKRETKKKDYTAPVTTSRTTATSRTAFPSGMQPVKIRKGEMVLYRTGYITSYNTETRIPNWVAWTLTKAKLKGNASRQGIEFHEDPEVPAPRVNTFDYQRSGYDRGHMCPAGDNKWSAQAMEESFLMTNMCPQNGNLNRGDWNEMEGQCRTWARKYGEIVIVCGPILYNQKHKTIGKAKVVVPEAFFKVVLVTKGEPRGIGFIYKNTDGNHPKDSYINTISQIERITGLTFFPELSKEVSKKVKNNREML